VQRIAFEIVSWAVAFSAWGTGLDAVLDVCRWSERRCDHHKV